MKLVNQLKLLLGGDRGTYAGQRTIEDIIRAIAEYVETGGDQPTQFNPSVAVSRSAIAQALRDEIHIGRNR